MLPQSYLIHGKRQVSSMCSPQRPLNGAQLTRETFQVLEPLEKWIVRIKGLNGWQMDRDTWFWGRAYSVGVLGYFALNEFYCTRRALIEDNDGTVACTTPRTCQFFFNRQICYNQVLKFLHKEKNHCIQDNLRCCHTSHSMCSVTFYLLSIHLNVGENVLRKAPSLPKMEYLEPLKPHVMQNAILFTVDDVSNVDMTSYQAFFFFSRRGCFKFNFL